MKCIKKAVGMGMEMEEGNRDMREWANQWNERGLLQAIVIGCHNKGVSWTQYLH